MASFTKQIGSLRLHAFVCGDIFSTPPPPPQLQPYNAFIVPANQFLVGCRLPYITRGMHIPYTAAATETKTSMSSNWGGHEIDRRYQLYPIECVDGLVHRYAGAELTQWLERLKPVVKEEEGNRFVKCLHGDAVVSPGFGLEDRFGLLVHTAVPFNEGGDAGLLLSRCYESSILAVAKRDGSIKGTTGLSHQPSKTIRMLTVLLGSGSRGFEANECCEAAFKGISQASLEMEDSGVQVDLDLAVRHFDILGMLGSRFS
ncbi:hypothetical protein BJ741DRAFT_633886 [Chytriomyces cf. hyalinus JEL632]|nr:hypothetical protein BJ741DRAFT_633886 [Chytriomyces cf. hyalinus JEL632]